MKGKPYSIHHSGNLPYFSSTRNFSSSRFSAYRPTAATDETQKLGGVAAQSFFAIADVLVIWAVILSYSAL